MTRKPVCAPTGALMSQKQLEQWLAKVKEFVRGHPELPRNQEVLALIGDWVAEVVNDIMFIRSPKLAGTDQKSELNALRVHQSALNKAYLPKFCGTGTRYRFAKAPRRDYYVLKPVSTSAPQIVVDKAYASLLQRIQSLPDVREVTIVQHSGKSTSDLIGELIRAGISVDLYLQDPAQAVNPRQSGKIDSEKRDARAFYGLDTKHGDASQLGRLRVLKYAVPATIRAVIVGESASPLLVSWGSYYYYRTDDSEAQPSGVNILGHLLPQVVVETGSEDFEVLAKMMHQFLQALSSSSELWDTMPSDSGKG